MEKLHVKKLGFSLGLTGAIAYLGCMIIMFIAGKEGTITFFNSLLHGLDVTQVVRMDISIVEAIFGIIQTFILGWLVGACIALLYNVQIKK